MIQCLGLRNKRIAIKSMRYFLRRVGGLIVLMRSS